MKRQEFYEITKELIENKVLKVLEEKGREYQSAEGKEENVFANFERTGKSQEIPSEKVITVFLDKHLSSIFTFVKDMSKIGVLEAQNKSTEPIGMRIVDAINYLLLLHGLICEKSDIAKIVSVCKEEFEKEEKENLKRFVEKP
ncbi:MAG TPA: hypothetical protein PLA71_00040 [Saccharofermentans sp.]|nr:hypothetical protein [Saccharofermentans sp.]